MSDPFAPDSRDQLIREAQRGLAIIAILSLIFGYIAIQRFRGDWNGIPEHVKNAPPSQIVWPYDGKMADREYQESDRRISETGSTSRSAEIDRSFASNNTTPTRPPGRLSSDGTTERTFTVQTGHAQSLHSLQIGQAEPNPQDSTFPSRSELATFESDASSPIGTSVAPKTTPLALSRTTENLKSNSDLPIPPANEDELQRQFSPIPNPPQIDESKSPSASLPRDPFGFSDSEDQPIAPSTPSKRFEGIDFFPVPLPNANKDRTDEPKSARKSPKGESETDLQTESGKQAFQVVNTVGSPELESKLNEKGLGDPNLLAPQVRSATVLDSFHPDQNSFSHSSPPAQLKRTATEEVNEAGIEYVVKEGDNFWSIAQAHYDDGRYFRPLYESNIGRVADFDSPKPGTKIIIPSLAKLRKDYPVLCKTISFTPREGDSRVSVSVEAAEPQKIRAAGLIASAASGSKRTYVTRNQDSLFKIAAEELGQASRYIELIELNRSNLPPGIDSSTPLAQGLVLSLPGL